jgi:large subunit ribosomal protein L29
MKIRDIRNLGDEELKIELERVREQLFSIRSQAVTEKLQDPTQLTKAKRDIARLLTVQHERELAAAGR